MEPIYTPLFFFVEAATRDLELCEINQIFHSCEWEERGRISVSRGLRNPLSPSLFLLVMDVLSRRALGGVEHNVIEGFNVGRDNLTLSHLHILDDMII